MGLRGSGKTTIGRLLAGRLGRQFIDLDDLTPRALGVPTVSEAFTRFGEPRFRQAELLALTEAMRTHDSAVIALGGGTPTAPGVPDLLRTQQQQGRAVLVYLAAEPDTLRERLERADNTHRPSLTGADPLVEIDAVHAKRDPLYRGLADEVIDTDELATDQVLKSVDAVTEPRP